MSKSTRLFAALSLVCLAGCAPAALGTVDPPPIDGGSDAETMADASPATDATLADATPADATPADAAADAAPPRPPVTPSPDDDPAIVARINELPSGHAMFLPSPTVHAPEGYESSPWFTYGPGGRDFSNQMAYAPERETALYAGANHGSPHRLNDVWEFHLGSNTWQTLYAPTGGDMRDRRIQWGHAKRLIDGETLTAEELAMTDEFRVWWRENVMLHDAGYLSINDPGHGPLDPSHCWDTLAYDSVNHRLVWPLLASRQYGMKVHQWAWDLPERPEIGEGLTAMLYFDLETSTWFPYRDQVGAPPVTSNSALSMVAIGGTEFVYAQSHWRDGVTGMFRWDSDTGVWTNMRPNDGANLQTLAAEGAFPQLDGLGEYSPDDNAILNVGQGDFVSREPTARLYRFDTNEWSATNPPGVQVSDASGMLVYASAKGRFVLLKPSQRQSSLFEFDVATETWEEIRFTGPELQTSAAFGYYDPRFDVVVLQQRSGRRVWVYRP